MAPQVAPLVSNDRYVFCFSSLQSFERRQNQLRFVNRSQADRQTQISVSSRSEDMVKLSVLGFNSSNVDDTIRNLREELQKLVHKDDWSNSPQKKWIAKLTKQQVSVCISLLFPHRKCPYISMVTQN
mgnify:CR=1 FL=1